MLVDEEMKATEAREVELLHADARRLREELEELRASRERLVRSADADRARIERELHDGLQQQLVALAVTLQHARRLVATDQSAADALLEEGARELRVALESTRALALRIFPALVDAGGLRLALRTAIASAGFSAEIDVPDSGDWPREVAVAIYFCCLAVLEQLGASAKSVVAVCKEAGEARFEITALDSQKAFAESDLALAADRIEGFGGRVVVMSGHGRGVRVSGSLPLPPSL
jgi:signal transduction histidine kinase